MVILDFLTPWRRKKEQQTSIPHVQEPTTETSIPPVQEFKQEILKGAPIKERAALFGATSIEEINKAVPREIDIIKEPAAESELYRKLEDERNPKKESDEESDEELKEWVQLHEREPNGMPDKYGDTVVQEPWFSTGEPPEKGIEFGEGKKTVPGIIKGGEGPREGKAA